jgi:hypothetical protein
MVLRPLIASIATLALNTGLWVRRLLNSFGEGFAKGGCPFQGRCPALEFNDGTCPEKPDHLNPQLVSSCRLIIAPIKENLKASPDSLVKEA